MADKTKFKKPIEKNYSVRGMLTQERMQEAQRTLRKIQTILWDTMDDEAYEEIERAFDTAIASVIAHMLEVDIGEIGREAGKGAAAPVLMPGA